MSTVLEKKIYQGCLEKRYLLNDKASSKRTFHIELSLEEPLDYKPGDSIGICPENDPSLVEAILQKVTDPSATIREKKSGELISFHEFLLKKANLSKVSPKAKRWFASKGIARDLPAEYDFLDYLEQKRELFDPQELVDHMLPQLPRYYSIASSPSYHPKELHLTVSYLETNLNNRIRKGVASYYLSYLLPMRSKISFFLHPSNHFTLPSQSTRSMIMIGPGTGIAPFRGFLYERMLQDNPGKNWLFFGERNKSLDFYYEDFFTQLEGREFLRLTTAFSRDQKEKIYVQHRMLQEKKEIWQWIEEGAYIFVCGDANNMAKAVRSALIEIATSEGNLSEEEAKLFWKEKRREKIFVEDVY